MIMDGLENHRRAVEGLLQDETLTSELTDEAAEMLLEWGVAQVEAALERARRSPQADPRASIGRLRRVMKRVNEQAGAAAPDLQAERLRSLLSRLDSRSESAPDA
jgi:hypothetical protein